MSVYTSIEETELHGFLKQYSAGTLLTYHGINEGIENTNYFVNTSQGQFVLTIFEQHNHYNLHYFLNLMAFLAEAGLSVPHPIPDRQGNYLRQLHRKPATLITRLHGRTIRAATVGQCRMLGRALAIMHLVTDNFKQQRNNHRGIAWCRRIGTQLLPCLDPTTIELLDKELQHHYSHPLTNIPAGTIHADLFRDNALFDHDQLTGIIDFYYACNDKFIYDAAITVNDWCVTSDGSFDPDRYQAFVAAYQQYRPFNEAEQAQWQNALRCAALRFWLSRLYDKHFPRDGHITHIKDPDFLKNILLQRIHAVPPLNPNQ